MIALLLNQSSLFEVFKEYESRVVGYNECISLSSDAIGAEDAVRLSTNPSLAILSAAPHKSLNTDSYVFNLSFNFFSLSLSLE